MNSYSLRLKTDVSRHTPGPDRDVHSAVLRDSVLLIQHGVNFAYTNTIYTKESFAISFELNITTYLQKIILRCV